MKIRFHYRSTYYAVEPLLCLTALVGLFRVDGHEHTSLTFVLGKLRLSFIYRSKIYDGL